MDKLMKVALGILMVAVVGSALYFLQEAGRMGQGRMGARSGAPTESFSPFDVEYDKGSGAPTESFSPFDVEYDNEAELIVRSIDRDGGSQYKKDFKELDPTLYADPLKIDYLTVSDNSSFKNVDIGEALKAENGILVRLKGIYNTPIAGNEMIELEFYIADQRLNKSRNFYRLWDGIDSKPDKLVLEDYGVVVSVETKLPSLNSVSMKIESKFNKNFTSGQELYEECLKNPPNFKNDGFEGHPLAVLCTKYYSKPSAVMEGYKIVEINGFTIIAKTIFSESQVKAIAKFVSEAYQKIENNLGYKPTSIDKPIIYLDDDIYHASVAGREFLGIRAQPVWGFSDVYETDITHELVHWFNRSIRKPHMMEEGFAEYIDYVLRLADGKNVYIKCKDSEIDVDLGAKFTVTYKDAGPYKLGACFWKELYDNYPLAYAKLRGYFKDNRIPGNTKTLLLADFLKNNTSSDFFNILDKKYLKKMANMYSNDIYSINVGPNPGDPMENIW